MKQGLNVCLIGGRWAVAVAAAADAVAVLLLLQLLLLQLESGDSVLAKKTLDVLD